MEGLQAVDVSSISSWQQSSVSEVESQGEEASHESPFLIDLELNEKISIWQGDQLSLIVDGVVNATSEFSDRTFFKVNYCAKLFVFFLMVSLF